MFHREGFGIIRFTFLGVLIANLLNFWLIDNPPANFIILIGTFIIFILILQFFRNPGRSTCPNDESVVAPVDGKVVVIEEVYEKEYFKDQRIQVSVFMSPVNVHVTRYPVGGEVVFSKYHPGKYLVAWHPKSSEKNERTTVVVKNSKFGEILHRQIAGAVARRIVNYAVEGEQVAQGADSGFIKFGSRLDVFLPLGTKIEVNLEDKVRGGETILAKFNPL